jgi:hypothetical protein
VVDLEIEREGVFEAVRSQNDRKIDSLSPEVLLSYTPDPLRPEASARHLYAVHWQAVDHLGVDLDEVAGVELGRYRFRALGPGFEVFSEPFEVTGEGVLALDLRLEEGLLVGRVGYEVEEGHRLLRVDGPSRGFVPTAGKLSLRVVSVASGAEVFLEVEAASGGELSLRLGLDLSRGVTLEVEDDLGNRASATLP